MSFAPSTTEMILYHRNPPAVPAWAPLMPQKTFLPCFRACLEHCYSKPTLSFRYLAPRDNVSKPTLRRCYDDLFIDQDHYLLCLDAKLDPAKWGLKPKVSALDDLASGNCLPEAPGPLEETPTRAPVPVAESTLALPETPEDIIVTSTGSSPDIARAVALRLGYQLIVEGGRTLIPLLRLGWHLRRQH
jgi:hypothetical protein